jgi:hypothetical protein
MNKKILIFGKGFMGIKLQHAFGGVISDCRINTLADAWMKSLNTRLTLSSTVSVLPALATSMIANSKKISLMR